MPKAFDACVKGGGKVRRVSSTSPSGKKMGLKQDEYVNICVKDGKSYKGYTRANVAAKALRDSY